MAGVSKLGGKASAEEQANEHVKEFFLALAAKGKADWNAWRGDPANKGVPVTFAGVDFSEAPRDQIDFSQFEFGAEENLNFSGCKWRGVKLPHCPNTFEPGLACFFSAFFGRSADFTSATFGDGADFMRLTSPARPSVTGDFTDAMFRGESKFDETHFKGSAAFNYQNGSAPLGIVSFSHARFDGEASFSNRWFEKTADFTNARFYYPPNFDGLSKIDFTGAHIGFVRPRRFHWTFQSRIPIRLRALRKIAEEIKNHDHRAQSFFLMAHTRPDPFSRHYHYSADIWWAWLNKQRELRMSNAVLLRKPGAPRLNSKDRQTVIRLGIAGSLLDRLDIYVDKVGKTRSRLVGENHPRAFKPGRSEIKSHDIS